MDDQPETRKEKKGSKKDSKDFIYTSRRVRQMESMIERKGIKVSSRLKIPGLQQSSLKKKKD